MVHDRSGVSHAGGDELSHLVHESHGLGQPAFLRSGGVHGSFCGLRVLDDAVGVPRAIRRGAALDPCSNLGDHSGAGRFRPGVYLRAGRPWLAWSVCLLRTVALLLNFLMAPNLNYRVITELRHIPFLGEPVAIAVGVTNPWSLLGQLSLVLFVVFIVDATLTVWRRGDRRQAAVVGGGIALCMVIGTAQAVLVLWGFIQSPITTSLFFLFIVMAIGFEMSRDVRRATRLADELQESEQRMLLATKAANLGIWIRDLVRNEIWATDQWRVLLGFSPTEPLSVEKFFQKIHPDDRHQLRIAVEKATATGGKL